MSRGRPTYLWAAESVLRRHNRPLRASEIVTYAQEQGLFSKEMFSRTPQKSLQRALSLEILAGNDQSRFVRVGKGLFYLRDLLGHVSKGAPTDEGSLGIVEDVTEASPYLAPRRVPATPRERVLVISQERYAPLLNFQGLQLRFKLFSARVG
jgi:hypothetical protein